MMNFCRRMLRKLKLFVLFWTRIVFVRNHFKVSFFHKLCANFGGGYTADQYALYDLNREKKKEYLSEFDWYRSRYINAPFDFAFNNKVVCSQMLRPYINTPENYFIKNKGVYLDFADGPCTVEEVLSCIRTHQKVFIKPFAMGKGNGVHLLSYEEGTYAVDYEPCTQTAFRSFLEQETDVLICEFIRQNAYAAALFPETANTIRLITMRDPKTHVFGISYAVQRIGRKETVPVDNGSRGGLVAWIDIETGILSDARCLHEKGSYPVHPDTGAPIEGVAVPGWDQIKEQMCEVCRHVPYMDFIAWDLLPTDHGLYMIEGNTSSGVNILQLWGGQRQEKLGAFFRYYGVIR